MGIKSYLKKPLKKVRNYVEKVNKRQRKEVRENTAEGVDSVLSALEDGEEYSSLVQAAIEEGATPKQARIGSKYIKSEQGKELLAKRGKKLEKTTYVDSDIIAGSRGIGIGTGLLLGGTYFVLQTGTLTPDLAGLVTEWIICGVFAGVGAKVGSLVGDYFGKKANYSLEDAQE